MYGLTQQKKTRSRNSLYNNLGHFIVMLYLSKKLLCGSALDLEQAYRNILCTIYNKDLIP